MALDLVARLKLNDEFSDKMRKVTRELGRAEQSTKSLTGGMSRFTTQVAGIASAIGITAAVAKGIDMISASIDGAISRYDTMNNFPKIMEQMGFSAVDSEKAIKRLSDGIQGLPTTLDSVVSTAQRIGTMTGDIEKATETTLALNNAFLSSGSGSEDAARGLQQYTQMMATGAVDLMSFRVLQETMGTALNQVAKDFGYAGASAQNDLFEALKNGEITIDQFNDKIIELSNAQGGFADQAKTASGGIRTAWTNIKNAVVRGTTGMIEAIDKALGGTGSIEDAINGMQGVINKGFKAAAGAISKTASAFKTLYDVTKPLHPVIEKVGKALLVAAGAIVGIVAIVGAFKLIGAAIAFITSPVGLVVLAIAGIAFALQQAYDKSETFREKVAEVTEKVKGAFDKVADAIDNVISAAEQGSELGVLTALGLSPEEAAKVIAVATNVWNSITGFIDRVKTAIGEVVGWLSQKWEELQPGIETLKSIFSTAGTVVKDVFKSLWAIVEPILSGIWSALKVVGDVVVMVFNNIIAPLLKYGWELFKTLWAVIGPILELIGVAIGAAFKVLKWVWDTILKPVVKFLMEKFKQAIETSTKALGPIQDAFETLGGKISGVVDWLKSVADWFGKIKVPDWVSSIGGKVTGFVGKTVANFAGGGTASSHYHGLDNVPYDGYNARLHKGEAVLTAQENKERKQGGGGGNPVNLTVNYNGGQRLDRAEMVRFAQFLASEVKAAGEVGA